MKNNILYQLIQFIVERQENKDEIIDCQNN